MDKVFVIEFCEPTRYDAHRYIHETVFKTFRGASEYLLSTGYYAYTLELSYSFEKDDICFYEKDDMYRAFIHECKFSDK